MAKQDVEMKEATQNNETESEEPKAEVSKEEKERLVLEGREKIILMSFLPLFLSFNMYIIWSFKHTTPQALIALKIIVFK